MTAENSALKCHVHDRVELFELAKIWENVCVNEKEYKEYRAGAINLNDLNESYFVHSDGKHYCLFHLPTKAKDVDTFNKIFRARLKAVGNKLAETEKLLQSERENAGVQKNYDFRYVWFPSPVELKKHSFLAGANYSGATFSAVADFRSATFAAGADFNGATFLQRARFNSAVFSKIAINSKEAEVDFKKTTFSAKANFSNAVFSAKANFKEALFLADVDFYLTRFSEAANFYKATFEEKSQVFFDKTIFEDNVCLNYTTLKGYIEFEGAPKYELFTGEKARLDLQFARITDPRKIHFHTVRLEPNWFINTDPSGFVFTNCQWLYAVQKLSGIARLINKVFSGNDLIDKEGKRFNVKTELEKLKDRGFNTPNNLLTKACWQLADNYEESKSFVKSSLFRQLALESKRLKNAWFVQPFTLHWWYYAVSFYGESARRAFAVFLGVLIFSALVYASPLSSFDFGERKPEEIPRQTASGKRLCGQPETVHRFRNMNFCEAAVYSLYVAALQRPEPKAFTTWTKFAVILETILAPLQAALLALAIRRKFMR